MRTMEEAGSIKESKKFGAVNVNGNVNVYGNYSKMGHKR